MTKLYVVILRETGETIKKNGKVIVVNQKQKDHIDLWLPQCQTKYLMMGETSK